MTSVAGGLIQRPPLLAPPAYPLRSGSLPPTAELADESAPLPDSAEDSLQRLQRLRLQLTAANHPLVAPDRAAAVSEREISARVPAGTQAQPS